MKTKRKFRSTLRILKKSTPEVRREIIKYAPHSLIELFSNSARTILNGKCNVKNNAVKKYLKHLREIGSADNSYEKKKKSIINQRGAGGCMGLLLKGMQKE